MKRQIGVIFGGQSVEHEISIITALQAIENIDRDKYSIIPIYISKKGTWYTDQSFFNVEIFKDFKALEKVATIVHLVNNENKFYLQSVKTSLFKKGYSQELDMVMPIVHGTSVEDGTLTGYLETLGIPVTGPSVTSGVVGQDKAVMKDILKANHVSQVDYLWYYESDNLDMQVEAIINTLGLPAIVKPATLGSSVAISIAHDEVALRTALENAYDFCHKVVIEKVLVDFKEVNISVLGSYDEVLLSKTELVAKDEDFLSYEDKYMSGGKKGGKTKQASSGMASLSRIIPAPVTADEQQQIETIAKTAFRVLNCESVIRIDLMIKDGVVYLNEVNNIPGSLSFYLWEETDLEYKDLLNKIIDLGVKKYFKKQKTVNTIDTNVLNMKGSKGK